MWGISQIRVVRQRRTLLAVSSLFLAALFAVTACTSITKKTLYSTEDPLMATATELSKTIFFPRQEKTEGERAVMEGEVDGKLVLVDNCVRVDSEEARTSYLLIWPPDFNISIYNGTIEILNGDGEKMAHIGDKVHIGGGEVPLQSVFVKPILEQIPTQCTGPYWVIGDEITTINP